MAVASPLNRVDLTGDGVTTVFTFTFPVYTQSDLQVYVTPSGGVAALQVLNSNYTQSAVNTPGGVVGGTISFSVAPPNLSLVTLLRNVPITQSTSFTNLDKFDAKTAIEGTFDKLVMLAQQLGEKLSRAFQVPVNASSYTTTLPDPTLAANQGLFLQIGATGIQAAVPTTATFSNPLTTKGDLLASDGGATPVRIGVGTNGQTLEADSTATGGLSWRQGVRTVMTTLGDLVVATASGVLARLGVGTNGSVLMAQSTASTGLTYAPIAAQLIYGLTYSNSAGDATNDLDLTAGGAMDSTGSYFMAVSALTKQSDVVWSVGTNAGGLDTGAVGNADYYIWLIARADTGVVDILYSLSSTSPTMPANYTYKRLIGWFKRAGGTIVACHTYEMEGGGLDFLWDSPTLDVNLSNTLTTSRRTDAVKGPLAFSTVAYLSILAVDSTAGFNVVVQCPDQADVAPNGVPNTTIIKSTSTTAQQNQLIHIRTSTTGTVASRADLATVDTYQIGTVGFHWARRN